MNIQIRLFAGIAERLGSSLLDVSLDCASIGADDLKKRLERMYPDAAAQIAVAFLAVNQEYASGDYPIRAEDEVALIPPVSGGDGLAPQSQADRPIHHSSGDGMHVITSAILQPDEVTNKVITPNHGATLVFVGTTREMTGELRTIHLEYEAYIPMALAMLEQISGEVTEQWPGTLCAISHRIGKVAITEASVVISVSSPHRDLCYEASRYAIERLKHKVPIWKKEVWENGSEWKGTQLGPWDPLTAYGS